MSEVTCYKCGARVQMGATHCPHCGASFSASRPISAPAAVTPSRSLLARLKAFLAECGIDLGGQGTSLQPQGDRQLHAQVPTVPIPQSTPVAPQQARAGIPSTASKPLPGASHPMERRPQMQNGTAAAPRSVTGQPALPHTPSTSQPRPHSAPSPQNSAYATVRLPPSEQSTGSQPLLPTPSGAQAAHTPHSLSASHVRMREKSGALQPLHAQNPLQPLSSGSLLCYPPQNPQRIYAINRAIQLTHSTYYDAVNLVCTKCGAMHHQLPADGMCASCHAAPLQLVLIHERPVDGASRPIPSQVGALIKLSRELRGVLSHIECLNFARSVYSVCDHPGRWWALRGRQSRSLDEAVAAIAQVAQVLAELHEQEYTWIGESHMMRESLILCGNNGNLSVADLTGAHEFATDPSAAALQRRSDVVFLGELLMLLLSGVVPPPGSTQLMPSALLPIVRRAQAGEYDSISVMIDDLEKLPSGAWASRTLKPRHGQATDPGLRHEDNQDTVVTFTFDKQQDRHTVPIGFYMVADGMGGHDAGGVASSTVYEVVSSWILNMRVLPDIQKATRKLNDDVSGDLLTQAITEANHKLYEHAQAYSLDMGSTVTAALIIGNFATVANVGDSRTYLLRQGRLEPITQDHSLVARLVSAGVIRSEDVRSHPQRNRIYRSLGNKPEVEVDTFTVPLMRGDRLILCCDGLWEMVEDAQIQSIVEEARTPQVACDALVAAANAAGGEDNISVIIVEME